MHIALRPSRPSRTLVWLVLLCAFLSLQAHAMHRMVSAGMSNSAGMDICYGMTDGSDMSDSAGPATGTTLQHAALDCSCGGCAASPMLLAPAQLAGLIRLEQFGRPIEPDFFVVHPAPRWLAPDSRAPPRI
jgi:hypothetical protein